MLSPAGRNDNFTPYVRALAHSQSRLEDAFDAMWTSLRDILTRELRTRSLWSSPPSYLGVYGSVRWTEDCSLLDELLTDCYEFIFIDRQDQLVRNAHERSIAGLVVVSLRQFIYHRQRRCDPLGTRVYEVLRGAVGEAVESGEWHVLRGSSEIVNATVLGQSPGTLLAEAADAELLRPYVQRWNDELLPDLVTGFGQRRQLHERIRRCLASLPDDGVHAFRFKDLIDPFKVEVRGRWAAAFDSTGDMTADTPEGRAIFTVRQALPGRNLAELEGFTFLKHCVTDQIDRMPRHKYRERVERLWLFLIHYADDEEQPRLPSARRLSPLLNIPRERFPDLFSTLAQHVRLCQSDPGDPRHGP